MFNKLRFAYGLSITIALCSGAACAGAPSWLGAHPVSQASQQQNAPDFAPFMRDLQQRVKSHWFPPKGDKALHGTVIFQVDRAGHILNPRLGVKTGIAKCDQAGLDAIKACGTLEPLPAGASPTVNIEFAFDYNVKTLPEAKSAESEGDKPPESRKAKNEKDKKAEESLKELSTPRGGEAAFRGFAMMCAGLVVLFETIMAIWIALWLGVESLKARLKRSQ